MDVGNTCPKGGEKVVKIRGVLSKIVNFLAARQNVESEGVSNEPGAL